jgi:hypothetical protein
VVGFPTRDDLERFAYIRRNRKPLTQEFINMQNGVQNFPGSWGKER